MSRTARQYAQDALARVSSILGERERTHGAVRDNMLATAALFEGYLNDVPTPVSPVDVCLLMALAKVGRIRGGDPDEPDHYLDAIGYFALAYGLLAEARVRGEASLDEND